jgi:hypothetical protein
MDTRREVRGGGVGIQIEMDDEDESRCVEERWMDSEQKRARSTVVVCVC